MTRVYSSTILHEIHENFTSTYKASAKFPYSCVIWDKLMESVNNVALMNLIIYNNDKFKEPPTKTFLIACPEVINSCTITKDDGTTFERINVAIGTFWGFVFQNVLGYKKRETTSIITQGVKEASYFYENDKTVQIIL